MKIQRLSLLEGSFEARGTTVIIDVFRAFTCEPLMYYCGAEDIILESDIERCLAIKGDFIRVGELNEVPIEGFDLTNSPYDILRKGKSCFSGKRVIHRTTSGVAGALNAYDRADEVLLASFVNAAATAEYIHKRHPDIVSIVAMGIRSLEKAPEDEYCGDYIESLLTGAPYDHVAAVLDIIAHETAQKFLRGDKPYLPREDPALCLQRDSAGIVLKAERRDGIVHSVRVDDFS